MERMDPSTLHLAAERLREVTDEHARWHENLLRSMTAGRNRAVASDASDASVTTGTRWRLVDVGERSE